MKDWLGDTEEEFVDTCREWRLILSTPEKVAAYGWDQDVVQAVYSLIVAFLNRRDDYLAVNSTENRIVKDEKKEAAKQSMRNFANTSIRFNDKMSEAAKAALGVHKDPNRTPHGTPTSVPETVVEMITFHYQHRIRAINPLTGKSSKPEDAYGVSYAWQLGGERPASGENLPKSRFSLRTNIIVRHTEADKGKTAYYATCYENRQGHRGDWSPIVEAVIG